MDDRSRRDRVIARGGCLGPLDHTPSPGSVRLDYKAKCPVCGLWVKVTTLGRYSHHGHTRKDIVRRMVGR